jgi:hypothetical protein
MVDRKNPKATASADLSPIRKTWDRTQFCRNKLGHVLVFLPQIRLQKKMHLINTYKNFNFQEDLSAEHNNFADPR